LKKYKFNELYEMSSGISSKPEQAGHGAPFLSFSTAFNNYFLPEKLCDYMDTSEKEQETYSILKGDIFLTRTSEIIDELSMSSVAVRDYPKATYSGFLKRLRPIQSDITYEKFMGFYLRSELFRKTMTNNAVLTLRASLNEQIFSYLDLILLEYAEQVKIGDLLYGINCKIELNNRINSELESMVKTLYDYWFVQYDYPDENGKPHKSSGGKMVWNKKLKRVIPEGWGDGSLLDIATFTNGIACQKYRPTGDDYLNVIKIKEMRDGFTKATERVRSDIPSKIVVENGDILFSWSASLLVMLWSGGKAGLNQHIFKVTSEKLPKSYVFIQLADYVSHFVKIAESRKTTMGHITREHLEQSRISIPNEFVVSEFDKKVKPLLRKQIVLKEQNQQLTELRDWLLPMLMNGQVKVN